MSYPKYDAELDATVAVALAPVPDVEAGSWEGRVWAEFNRVGGGSSAWLSLVGAIETATTFYDDRVADTVDWAAAWSLYEQALGELSPSDARLAEAYDLEELPECRWCNTRDTEDNLVRYGTYDQDLGHWHRPCLVENLREIGLA